MAIDLQLALASTAKRSIVLHTEDICFENPESVNYKPNLGNRRQTTNDCMNDQTDSCSINYGIKEVRFFGLTDSSDNDMVLKKAINYEYRDSNYEWENCLNAVNKIPYIINPCLTGIKKPIRSQMENLEGLLSTQQISG
jgi:hypothetical protein